MTEYVTPNIHSVLKKYQNTAPKSLQGPGHTLVAAATAAAAAGICSTGSNCPLDATSTSVVSSDSTTIISANIIQALSPCSTASLALTHTNGVVGIGTIAGASIKKSAHFTGSTTAPLQKPVMPLIKKEILSSPEPHELNEPSPPTIKIVPPPRPELKQPILSVADSGSGELHETCLEGKTIGCFSLGGELRLCLPQFLNNVLADFTLDQINRIFDELGIFCSQCTPDQLLEFKAAKILPSDVKASGLITRTDAERLCAALLHRSDRNSYINVEDIPKGAKSFKVYHRCFGKCEGICTPEMYSFTKPICIMCLECKGWFSPQKFVGHVHRKVENRTCHWGFDSRNWHDYLHVALDVENREKYQKMLDELKEVEIKEVQRELNYMKRKIDLLIDDSTHGSTASQALPLLHPPTQHLHNRNKHRSEPHDIPLKRSKTFDELSAYHQLDYQRFHHTLMYAHCTQQQRVGQMSAFRPWAPHLHAAAVSYNAAAVAALSTLPYLSQEPPVLQNPERVVRNIDRERFERTYQPNVALAPRKSILTKERENDQKELREREREREREGDRERVRIRGGEHDLERLREKERSIERDKERDREREDRTRELHKQHPQKTRVQTNFCEAKLHIKQERPNTPLDLPLSPSLVCNEKGISDQRSGVPIGDEVTMTVISPLTISVSQQHHKSNNSEMLQQRPFNQNTSNSSTCSNSSSTASITPPQQQLLPAHLPLHDPQQHNLQHITIIQQHSLRQSPRTPSPMTAHSSEEFSGSNEITSSTSPVPNSNNFPQCPQRQQQIHSHSKQIGTAQKQSQTIIATVNQHAKLLPASVSAIFNLSAAGTNNKINSANSNEIPSRIRISKNLINQPNIVRSPTPPTSSAAHHLNSQQYEYYKQNQKLYTQRSQHQTHESLIRQQHTLQSSTAAGINLSTNSTNVVVNQRETYPYQFQNGILYIGNEFEISTDTDDESLSGEPDSSNFLGPWDVAVEALRDTRPKDRERILKIIQKLLLENQQYRCSNLQLNEIIHKRDAVICELREELQKNRQQLDVANNETSVSAKVSGLHNEEICVSLDKCHREDIKKVPETTTIAVDENEMSENQSTVVIKLQHSSNQYKTNACTAEEEKGKDIDNLTLPQNMKRELDTSNEQNLNKNKIENESSSCQNTNVNAKEKPIDSFIGNVCVVQNGNVPDEERIRLASIGSDGSDIEEDQANGNCIQAPHSSALLTPPTATTPISPDSAVTAGQLFDSSNSSDESSMKKAQMSASNALAKISEINEDIEEEEDNENEDILNNDNIQPAAKEKIKTKVLNIDKHLVPCNVTVATKASRKETPTTNCEIQIKQELI